MATQTYDLTAGVEDTRGGSGWITFAAILIGLAGAWNLIDGILAIANSHVYTANATYVFSDLRTWGWIVTVLGAGQVLAALAIPSGSELGRWFGIGVASLNAIGQLAFVTVYPGWALTMFAVDILVIYALSVHGGHKLRAA